MHDLFPVEAAPEAIYSADLRIEPVTGDFMSPRLRSGRDYVLVRPINKLVGEGTYIYFDGIGPAMANVQLMFDRVRLFPENNHYTEHFMTRAEFEENVLALVVADINVRNEHFLREA